MPVGRPIAEPSDDPKIQRRREKARLQARERAAVARQLKEKNIPMTASLDRKQAKRSSVVKEKDCEEQLAIVKKELKRKQAQIKFLAQNINKVDASASSVKGSPASVVVSKKSVDTLVAKADEADDVDDVVKDMMATKIQTAMRGKKARLTMGVKKYEKATGARYLKKLEDDKKAKMMPKPSMTSEDRRKKDNAFGK